MSESVPEKATPVAESPEKPVERAAAVAANPGKVVVKQERTGSATGMQEEEENEKKESLQSQMEPKTDSSSAVAGGTPEEPKPVPHADLVRRAQPATDGVEGRGETHVRASRSPEKSESQCAEEDALPSFPSTPSPSREVVKEEAASDSTSEDGINEEQESDSSSEDRIKEEQDDDEGPEPSRSTTPQRLLKAALEGLVGPARKKRRLELIELYAKRYKAREEEKKFEKKQRAIDKQIQGIERSRARKKAKLWASEQNKKRRGFVLLLIA